MSDTVKDSTPTAVTVSDRMRDDLDKLLFDAWYELDVIASTIEQFEPKGMTIGKRTRLKSLREVQARIKAELSKPAPAEERLEDEMKFFQHTAAESFFRAEASCLPQTPGEAMPDLNSTVSSLKNQVKSLIAENTAVATLHQNLRNENARLLTALDEKEKAWATEQRINRIQGERINTLTQQLNESRSAVVLQKEALQSKIDRLRAAGNQLSNCAFNLAQPEVTMTDDRRATLKRCQEDWDNARIA